LPIEASMRCKALILSALVGGAILSGCAVGPNYVRPAIATPAAYMGQAAVDQRNVPGPTDLTQWWEAFDDPVLTRLEALALAQNLDLAQAIARVGQSRAALRSADAALLPSGGVSGQATHVHLSEQTPLGELLAATPNYDRDGELYETDIGASWEIDLFGGLRRQRESALAYYQAARADAVATRLAVAAQTADAFITVRGLQARIAIARQQIDTQSRLLTIVRLQYQKGVAAQLQLSQAEGVLAQVQATLPVLEDALEAAFNGLDVMLGGQPGDNRALVATPADIPAAPSVASAGGPPELLRRRPDIIAAERRLAASNALIGAAISEYYPKVSLSGLIGTASMRAGSVFTDSRANEGQGGAALAWRLFDFGRIGADVSAARGRNAEALAAYRLSVLRATEDVEDAFSTLVKREAQARTLAGGETSLTRARDSSLAAYKGGAVSLIEVLDADSRLLDTRDAHAQARTQAARAAVASFRALGGGWDPARPG
jgi:NodT family efflux transporter outer membrane factor (OMF) lipoprotein